MITSENYLALYAEEDEEGPDGWFIKDHKMGGSPIFLSLADLAQLLYEALDE